jgi:colicin import membrane protein
MIASGEVVEARVIKSSGNTTFDRQAELAVRKASPLPVPDNPRLLQQIVTQGISFEFDPSGIN